VIKRTSRRRWAVSEPPKLAQLVCGLGWAQKNRLFDDELNLLNCSALVPGKKKLKGPNLHNPSRIRRAFVSFIGHNCIYFIAHPMNLARFHT
jgi:hypothetical protein